MKKKRFREIEINKKKEQAEIRRKLAEHRKLETEQLRVKEKADKQEKRKIKEELKKELRERDELAKKEWEQLSRADQEKLKARLALQKQERALHRKKLQNLIYIRIRQFLYSFKSSNLKRNIRLFREKAPRRRLFLIIAVNSTIQFILSYLVYYLIYQIITVITSSFFNYPTIIYYYQVYFNISPEAWYHDSVRTIFSSGPLILFIIGIISLILYSNMRELTGNFKLFFLWGFLHGVNMLFGSLLVGTLFEAGVGHVISWMYVMDTGKVLFSTVSIFILVVAGIISLKPFLISGNAYFNEITRENRGFLLRSQVLLPYFAGTAIIFLVRQPQFMFYETVVNLVMLICLVPVMVIAGTSHDLFFDEEEKKPRVSWIFLMILAVIILLYRGVLAIGLRFG